MIICTHCKATRAVDETPCPYCGAPSPIAAGQKDRGRGLKLFGRTKITEKADVPQALPQQWVAPGSTGNDFWGGPPSIADNYAGAVVPQIAFESGDAIPPAFPLGWLPPGTTEQEQQLAQAAERQAGLPVPYQQQYPTLFQDGQRQPTVTLQLVPEHMIGHLIPAEQEEAVPVYVPPMYTKPRALIPRYRAISGFVSVLIVALLLCTGVGYYAKASGKLDLLHRFLSGSPPQSIPAAQTVNLPDPPDQTDKDKGPAYTIIPSATTALVVDPATNFARQPAKIFKPGQTFYLVFTVQPQKSDGTISAKWYTNGNLYKTSVGQLKVGQQAQDGKFTYGNFMMSYQQATEGMVELYWNDQFAQRLYFVVR